MNNRVTTLHGLASAPCCGNSFIHSFTHSFIHSFIHSDHFYNVIVMYNCNVIVSSLSNCSAWLLKRACWFCCIALYLSVSVVTALFCIIIRQVMIDYLKIDIEYSEWSTLDRVLNTTVLSRVKQFGLETHTRELFKTPSTVENLIYYSEILRRLQAAGFYRWYWHYNKYGVFVSQNTKQQMTCCYEMVFINVNIPYSWGRSREVYLVRHISPEVYLVMTYILLCISCEVFVLRYLSSGV